jgi:hypothetical protein
MTDIYEETILISCDRESAQTKQDDGLNSTWTNNFNETLQLEPGDRVSVYNSFVSERGSATSNSVEFKGVSLNKTKKIKYSTITKHYHVVGNNLDDPVLYREDINQVEENQEIFDNKTSIVINYYKTMDCLSYYQLPRRFIKNNGTVAVPRQPQENAWFVDDSADMGRVSREASDIVFTETIPTQIVYVQQEDKYGLVDDDYVGILDESANTFTDANNYVIRQGRVKRWILKNNNERFTIMARKKNILEDVFNDNSADPRDHYPADWDDQFPPYYARDPEFFDYVVYREKIDLEVSAGFNSAEYISTELTRQLQQTEVEEPDEQQNPYISVVTPGLTRSQDIKQKTNLLLNSKCYKPFNSSNDFFQTNTNYETCVNNNAAALGVQVGIDGPTLVHQVGGQWEVKNKVAGFIDGRQTNRCVDYYQSYQYIGCKRPEIYEAGIKLNDIFGFSLRHLADLDGTHLHYKRYGMILNLEYNNDNLTKLKNFIESQEIYPELFKQKNIKLWSDASENIDVGVHEFSANPYVSENNVNVHVNVNNARYLHMNDCLFMKLNNSLANDGTSGGVNISRIQLGNSYYDWIGNGMNQLGVLDQTTRSRTHDEKTQSRSFFFAYDPLQKDKYYDTPLGYEIYEEGVTSKKLTYGAFGKTTIFGVDYIMIFPNVLQGELNDPVKLPNTGRNVGLPPTFFTHASDGVNGILTDSLSMKLGYDRHFNAWGNAFINLTTGIPEYSYNKPYPGNVDPPPTTDYDGTTTQYGYSFPDVNNPQVGNTGNPSVYNEYGHNLQVTNKKQYLGADRPNITYDGNHFSFANLHTDLNKGGLDELNLPPTGDEGNTVYKINPTQKYNNWSPVQFPYEEIVKFDYTNSDPVERPDSYTRVNRNLSTFTIFDTTTGIFIEDFGYDETTFDDGLWGRLGFVYKQFNSGAVKSDRNTRMSGKIVNTNILTTNCNILTLDSKSWSQDKFYNSFHDGGICKPYQFFAYHTVITTEPVTKDNYLKFLPEIIEPATSTRFIGEDYPVQLDNGYYGIRSDLLSNNINTMGDGNTAYPLVAIADKINAVKDFYISSPGSVQHTITKPKILSSITTKICDPDGSPSRCSEKSVIVYRIEKTRRTTFDILEQMRERFAREEAEKNKK